MSSTSTSSTTIFHISNLHCDICVSTVQEILGSLDPRALSVDVSLATQSVIVRHLVSLPPGSIQDALGDVGFDAWEISGVFRRYDHLSPTQLSDLLVQKQAKHVLRCGSCRGEAIDFTEGANRVDGSVPNQCIPKETTSGISFQGASASRAQSGKLLAESSAPEGPSRVTLSVGGMTCSACTGTISRMVSDLPGVSEVVVSVIERSATAVIQTREVAAVIAECIEDCGFEASVVNIEPLGDGVIDATDKTRTLSLRVEGIFSSQCVEKINDVLRTFEPDLTLVKPLASYADPVLQVSYSPSPPSLTIRTIIAAISSAKSPPYSVSIYQPPSIEELARKMQIREQRRLLKRFFFTLIVAIPTLFIGIVYMSLVPKTNRGRQYLMEPMWIGNTSRTEWALFFLSTPVMFYSCSMFHLKSFKEIRSLWKKGSTVPLIRKFTRFGSMNLLVSSGVSVAYFASIVLLVLAATEAPNPMGGNTTTYFDSVVFLTLFLLGGRFLEAYSKSRTADAVKALGMLRPSEALLLVPRTGSEDHYKRTVSDRSSISTTSAEDLEKGDPSQESETLATKLGFVMEKVEISMLEVGDIVRVQNGASPPADGTIVEGNDSTFDESSLTGESRLIKKNVGDQVFVGTINKSKKMVNVRVDAVGGGTMLDHIAKVVRQGQSKRAPIERLADLLTSYFVPVVTLIAIFTWLLWLALGLSGALPKDYLDIEIGGWPVWSLEFAIAVFVVACPCGIGLAAPTALLVGSGLAAKFGILARGGGEAFQEMAQVDVVVFDKTGTLTEGGEPRVSDARILHSLGRWEANVVLGFAAEIESASSHPLAIAIKQYCEANGALAAFGSAFEETAGRGLKAHFAAHRCSAIIGNEAWMGEHNAEISIQLSQQLDDWKSEAKSVVLVAIRDEGQEEQIYELAAIFSISDHLRPEAAGVIEAFKRQGVDTWMISGDNIRTAKAIASKVGIPESRVIAGVLPHQKAKKVQWLQKFGNKRPSSKWTNFGGGKLNDRCIVAMVGDGINDAPALTAADIGIAIGSGSDVAISSASFILISSNLRCLLTLSDLSRKVFNRVKFNFVWAVMYNVAAVPIAAGALYPAGRVRLNPIWASLAMALSSVSVICSSLMLKTYKESKIKI